MAAKEPDKEKNLGRVAQITWTNGELDLLRGLKKFVSELPQLVWDHPSLENLIERNPKQSLDQLQNGSLNGGHKCSLDAIVSRGKA